MLGGELDAAGDKGVLRAAVDERRAFEYTGNCKDCRRGDLRVAGFDGCQKVCSRIVDSWNDVGVTLSIGGPLNNDFIKPVVFLERPVDVSRVDRS